MACPPPSKPENLRAPPYLRSNSVSTWRATEHFAQRLAILTLTLRDHFAAYVALHRKTPSLLKHCNRCARQPEQGDRRDGCAKPHRFSPRIRTAHCRCT